MSTPSEGSGEQQDIEQARRYLEALGQGATKFTFQTFDDDRDREKSRREVQKSIKSGRKHGSVYVRVMNGTLDEHWGTLAMLNLNGAGVFVTVQETDGEGRAFENIKRLRAIWCECDTPGPQRTDWPLQPHIVIESSPSKYHYYWLTEPLQWAQFTALHKRMSRVYGSDRQAMDACRVLRLPGTWHAKRDHAKGLDGTRWLVQLVECNDLAPYTDAELIAAFGADWEEEKEASESPEAPQGAKSQKRQARSDVNLESLLDALKAISPDDRDVWLAIGMALHGAGFPGAREAWDEWSARSPKYDAADQQRVWESFRRRPTGEDGPVVGLGTVYEHAKRSGWHGARDIWREGLLLNDRGRILDCPANLSRILTAHPEWRESLRYNTLSHQVEKKNGCPLGAGPWTDTDDVELLSWLAREARMPVRAVAQVQTVVEAIATRAPFNPAAEYLESLPPWDGMPRLESLFSSCWGVKSDAYVEALGYCLCGSIVWRVMSPGSPAPQTVVLRGDEQIGKSWMARIIGGPWYKSITMSMEGKEIYTALAGCILGELADLDSLGRTGERRIKAFLTTLTDTWRPHYARRDVAWVRLTTFLGTANPDAPLPDGQASRWLPVDLGAHRLNADLLERSRDQLFAQALAYYRDGKRPWLTSNLQERADEERMIAQVQDTWEVMIADFLVGKTEVSALEICGKGCLDIPLERQTRTTSTRIGIIISRWPEWRKARVTVGGRRAWVWRRS